MGQAGIPGSFRTDLLNFSLPKEQVGNLKPLRTVQSLFNPNLHPKIQSCKEETTSDPTYISYIYIPETEITSFNSQFTEPTVPNPRKVFVGEVV